MISNTAFMKGIDYRRMQKCITRQRLCEEIGISKKEYEHYLYGRKTPPVGVVLELVKYFGLGAF